MFSSLTAAITEVLCCIVGFAFIFYICGGLIQNERFKQYCNFFIHLCMLLCILTPLSSVNFSVDLNDILAPPSWEDTSSPLLSPQQGVQYTAMSILTDLYPDGEFTVRCHISENNNIYIYITAAKMPPNASPEEIKNALYEKIGISSGNVNIYLTYSN